MEKGHVTAESGLGFWEGKVKRLEPCFDLSCHSHLLILANGLAPQAL
jgi:hypothetical protein